MRLQIKQKKYIEYIIVLGTKLFRSRLFIR